jgi:hypothetical protein
MKKPIQPLKKDDHSSGSFLSYFHLSEKDAGQISRTKVTLTPFALKRGRL